MRKTGRKERHFRAASKKIRNGLCSLKNRLLQKGNKVVLKPKEHLLGTSGLKVNCQHLGSRQIA